MKLPSSQILGLFHRLIRKFVQLFSQLEEGEAGAGLATPTDVDLQPIAESVDNELVCGRIVAPLHSFQGEGERKNHTSLYLVTSYGMKHPTFPPMQTKAGEEWSRQQARQREEMVKGDLSQ